MRPIDAAIKDLEMIGDCRTCGNKTPFCDSNPDGCSGYKWRGVPFAATDDSRPLTLEELREMDGEPVWVKEIVDGMEENWGIITVSERGLFARTVIGSYSKCTYGYYWLAYRRKPEEGT